MTIEVPKYKKGIMGYMLDLRKAMGALELNSREWCAAFDKGDNEALERAGKLISETMGDVEESSSALVKAGK